MSEPASVTTALPEPIGPRNTRTCTPRRSAIVEPYRRKNSLTRCRSAGVVEWLLPRRRAVATVSRRAS